jgi:hypothetical protein
MEVAVNDMAEAFCRELPGGTTHINSSQHVRLNAAADVRPSGGHRKSSTK